MAFDRGRWVFVAEPAAAGLGSGRLTSAGRLALGPLSGPGGRLHRGAVPGSTGRAPAPRGCPDPALPGVRCRLALGLCRGRLGLREGNRHAPRSNLEPAGLREVDRLREGSRSSVAGGFALRLWPVQVDAFTVERCQDQPAGLRLREGVRLPAPGSRLREDLREGVQVQRRPSRPGPLPRLARTPGGEQARPPNQPRTGRAPRGCPAPGSARTFARVSGAVSPWASVRSRWKPSPWSGARINRPGSGSAAVSPWGSAAAGSAPVPRCPRTFTVPRCQDQPTGLRLRDCFPRNRPVGQLTKPPMKQRNRCDSCDSCDK